MSTMCHFVSNLLKLFNNLQLLVKRLVKRLVMRLVKRLVMRLVKRLFLLNANKLMIYQ